jgi:hypothetical protein
VYQPNATTTRLPVSVKLPYASLKPGGHTLKVKITYTETETRHRQRTSMTHTLALEIRFTIC